MPKIIVTSTFRKGGKAGKNGGAGGLLKYMGTREGVEKLPLSKENKPATKQQKSLIASVVSKIPYRRRVLNIFTRTSPQSAAICP